MAIFDIEASRAHETEFEAVNNSATFIFMVGVVAILIGVPLAIFL